jgi:hypothetical protein
MRSSRAGGSLIGGAGFIDHHLALALARQAGADRRDTAVSNLPVRVSRSSAIAISRSYH